jgi:hypothetical protein
MTEKPAMNIRGVDEKLYNEFKSMVFKVGYKSVKSAVIDLMKQFVQQAEQKTK